MHSTLRNCTVRVAVRAEPAVEATKTANKTDVVNAVLQIVAVPTTRRTAKVSLVIESFATGPALHAPRPHDCVLRLL